MLTGLERAKLWYWNNKYNPKFIERKRLWSIKYRAKQAAYIKAYNLKRGFNLSVEDYNDMKKSQDDACKICGRKVKLAVDHCHTTNKVRGLLCITCNTHLGWYEREKINIERYLE